MIQGYVSAEAGILLFLFFAFTIAVLLKQLQHRYSFVPYTPSLFMISVGLGYFSEYEGVIGEAIDNISQIDPRGILILFLPPLIFESAFNSDWHIFRKQSVQIFILAFPCVVSGALMIMCSIKMIIGYSDDYYTYSEAFMFGSVLSCTDTVAVLALLKEAGAPKKFNSLIEGQSLFNDGSCMVLMIIAFELVKGGEMHAVSVVLLFFELTIGGIVLGILFGMASTFLISRVSHDYTITLTITVTSCYLLYFTAQYVDKGIRVSGIMSLVALGLYMAAFGKTKISHEVRNRITSFWHVLVFSAETIIFILGGVLVGKKVLSNSVISVVGFQEIKMLGGLYICMTMARFLSISLFMPKLSTSGYGLKWNEVLVLTYGGLRGAVGIAFTLILAADENLDEQFRMICLFNMAGYSFLTLAINAPTCGSFIVKMGLCVKSETKARYFYECMKSLKMELDGELREMREDKYFTKADWKKVYSNAGISDLEAKIQVEDTKLSKVVRDKPGSNESSQELAQITDRTLVDDLLPEKEVDSDVMMELRNTFSVALKGILWGTFQRNLCSAQSIRLLMECANWDLDTLDEPLKSWQYLLEHLHNPYFIPFMNWAMTIPLLGNYIFSVIYDRVGFTYDVISTYLEAMEECVASAENRTREQEQLSREAYEQMKLAKKYLEDEIAISYPEIMERIQTAKAAQSIINHQKDYVRTAWQSGQIDDGLQQQIKTVLDVLTLKITNDSGKDGDICRDEPEFEREGHAPKASTIC